MTTLMDWAPREFQQGIWDDSPAWKFRDMKVIKEYSMFEEDIWKSWPGVHKNVKTWCILENGYAVGWNENGSRGWSFPVIKYKKWKGN
jgi:hypothetical protein